MLPANTLTEAKSSEKGNRDTKLKARIDRKRFLATLLEISPANSLFFSMCVPLKFNIL